MHALCALAYVLLTLCTSVLGTHKAEHTAHSPSFIRRPHFPEAYLGREKCHTLVWTNKADNAERANPGETKMAV